MTYVMKLAKKIQELHPELSVKEILAVADSYMEYWIDNVGVDSEVLQEIIQEVKG